VISRERGHRPDRSSGGGQVRLVPESLRRRGTGSEDIARKDTAPARTIDRKPAQEVDDADYAGRMAGRVGGACGRAFGKHDGSELQDRACRRTAPGLETGAIRERVVVEVRKACIQVGIKRPDRQGVPFDRPDESGRHGACGRAIAGHYLAPPLDAHLSGQHLPHLERDRSDLTVERMQRGERGSLGFRRVEDAEIPLGVALAQHGQQVAGGAIHGASRRREAPRPPPGLPQGARCRF
jgi:hypothetical protein